MAKAIQTKVTSVDAETVGEVITSNLPKFTKSQLVNSRKYIHRRDALNALLQEDEQYSYVQVDKILKHFDEGVKN